jgi:16S rRNA (guanine966-N2)-methyltransferase
MRIIAGTLKGRLFNDPPRNTYNPMSEKMRGALFNTLGDIEGLTVLDPFGGTGAISFEAISRGAASSIVIEHDKRAHANIYKNIVLLELEDKVKAIRANASGWSDNNPDVVFDLLLMDPPYDNLQLALIQKLIDSHVKENGVIVMSAPGRLQPPAFAGVTPLAVKKYGDGQLAFYRKNG